MARLSGGIFSRPSGSNHDLTFGRARTLEAKVVTVRQKSIPSNPNTVEQQRQRATFGSTVQTVRAIGQGTYRFDFNRAVGELPGFQSLMTYLLSNSDVFQDLFSYEQLIQSPLTLGRRHFPDLFSVDTVTADGQDFDIEFSWSDEIRDLGSDFDQLNVIVLDAVADAEAIPFIARRGVTVSHRSGILREAGSHTIEHESLTDTGNFLVGIYFTREEVGLSQEDRISPLHWVIAQRP